MKKTLSIIIMALAFVTALRSVEASNKGKASGQLFGGNSGNHSVEVILPPTCAEQLSEFEVWGQNLQDENLRLKRENDRSSCVLHCHQRVLEQYRRLINSCDSSSSILVHEQLVHEELRQCLLVCYLDWA